MTGKWSTRMCSMVKCRMVTRATCRRRWWAAPFQHETAHTLSEMLANSLESESSDALVPGYRIAGKTGTAQIPNDTGYDPNEINASFIGWGPVDNPRFVVYVWLEKPQSNRAASVVAAPIFAKSSKNWSS